MLRPLSLLVAVSSCASSVPGLRANAPADSLGETSARSAGVRVSDDRSASGARLAPPFGGTAGVRRVVDTTAAVADAAPDVVAAAGPRD